MSRYRRRKKLVNDTQEYQDSEIFENRGVKKITQLQSPIFKRFTKEEYKSVSFRRHYWTNGDKFWKLSQQFYGDMQYWWLIARWNFVASESDLTEGQEIRIPTDLELALGYVQ